MSKYQVTGSEHPFVCCTEPITDLSHDAEDLFVPYGEQRSDDFFASTHYPLPDYASADELLFAVCSEPAVFAPLEVVVQADASTYKHAMRVGNCAARAALALELDMSEAKIAVRAALLHDHGKVHPEVQAAIHAPSTVQSNPSLYDSIRLHPWHGVRMLAPYCHSANVLQVVGNHHSLQTERPAYGVFSHMVNMPEADGLRPYTGRLLEIVAASDLFDALWNAPQARERRYQELTGESYANLDFLQVALSSLRISDRVRQTVYDFARGYQAVNVNNRLD